MFCRNCGAELQESASVCPKCGTAVNVPVASAATKSSQRNLPKKSTLIASVLVVILIALTAWYFLRPTDPGYYQNIPWGTSYEDFMQEHPEAFGKQSSDGSANVFSTGAPDSLHGFEDEEIDGDILLMYKFDKNELYQASWTSLNSAQSESLIPEIIKKYNKLYNKPIRSDDPTINTDLKEYNYIWETKESTIQLLAVPGLESVIVIQTEINHSDVT